MRKMGKCILVWMMVFMLCLAWSNAALAESHVINRFSEWKPVDAEGILDADAEILEIVLPPAAGSDACILRMGDEVWMIDASFDIRVRNGVLPVLEAMGIDHINTAFVSHPHDDHMKGFATLLENGITIDRMMIALPEDINWVSINSTRAMHAYGVDVVQIHDGDSFTLGSATIDVMHRIRDNFTMNDLSAICMITYGDRTYLTTGYIENRAQAAFMEEHPAMSLKADILKHPHHGYAPISQPLLDEIDPELIFITGVGDDIRDATGLLQSRKVSYIVTYPRPIRMRTDGKTWLVDDPGWKVGW